MLVLRVSRAGKAPGIQPPCGGTAVLLVTSDVAGDRSALAKGEENYSIFQSLW